MAGGEWRVASGGTCIQSESGAGVLVLLTASTTGLSIRSQMTKNTTRDLAELIRLCALQRPRAPVRAAPSGPIWSSARTRPSPPLDAADLASITKSARPLLVPSPPPTSVIAVFQQASIMSATSSPATSATASPSPTSSSKVAHPSTATLLAVLLPVLLITVAVLGGFYFYLYRQGRPKDATECGRRKSSG